MNKSIVKSMVIIFGIKVNVCFWIWVVVWNILIMRFIIRVSISIGVLVSSDVYIVFLVRFIINFEVMIVFF